MKAKLRNVAVKVKEKTLNYLKVRTNVYFLLLLLLGVVLRVVKFGTTPIGLNQDEAYAGYEAFSLANWGIDSSGYHNPVYFVSWGSGMNVLESYLAIPFVKIFGLSVYTIRLPQLICAIFSLPVLYSLLLEITQDKQLSLIGLGLMAISPWHIMLSRWALESNLAPAFLLFGLYFFVKGIKKNYKMIFSAIFYGLALYSYAITWAVVPLTLGLSCLYLLITKTKVSLKYALISIAILFVLALPLMLFVLVNNNVIPEIKTKLISIPKMLVMRDSEIKFSHIFNAESYYDLFNLLIKQNDGLEHNSTEFGLFYKFSIPFALVGLTILIVDFVKSVKTKTFNSKFFVLSSLICSLMVSLMLEGKNVNRINAVHINVLILVAFGLNSLFNYFKNTKTLKRVFVVCYAVSLMFFSFYYFGKYNSDVKDNFRAGAKEAVEFVNEKDFKVVCVDYYMYYPQLLFFDETPTKWFLETVKWNYRGTFSSVKSFTKYTFNSNLQPTTSYDAFIIPNNDYEKGKFVTEGYLIEEFEEFAVAYKS